MHTKRYNTFLKDACSSMCVQFHVYLFYMPLNFCIPNLLKDRCGSQLIKGNTTTKKRARAGKRKGIERGYIQY